MSSAILLLLNLRKKNTNGIDRTPFDDNIQNYKPSLRVFLPSKEKATGRAVIACPGGAYGGLAYGHEGYEWAPFFNKLGITLVVLKYRMDIWLPLWQHM